MCASVYFDFSVSLLWDSLTTDDVFWTTDHVFFFLSFQVIERLLSIPAGYWSQYAYSDDLGMDNAHQMNTPDHKGKLLKGTS